MFEWYYKYIDYIYEAYEDGLKHFGAYIRRTKPLFFRQYFEKQYRPFVKEAFISIVKKLLRRS